MRGNFCIARPMFCFVWDIKRGSMLQSSPAKTTLAFLQAAFCSIIQIIDFFYGTEGGISRVLHCYYSSTTVLWY